MMQTTLETRIVEPQSPATACVIWLHGLGADASDFLDLTPQFTQAEALGIRFVFPNAPIRPVTLNQGMAMRAWFDIDTLEEGFKPDIDGMMATEEALHELIEQQQAQGISPEKIILAGFSQGGTMALFCGLRYPKSLGGIIGLSTLIPEADSIGRGQPIKPIFLGHGLQDKVIEVRWGEITSQKLQAAQYPVEWHTYPMLHSVCLKEIQDIDRWLGQVLA